MSKKLGFMGIIVVIALVVTGYSLLTAPKAMEGVAPASIAAATSGNDDKLVIGNGLNESCLPDPKKGPYDPPFPNFGSEICSEIPLDAYNSANFGNTQPRYASQKSETASNLAKEVKLQRIYDIFSWQSFLAINWPVDDQGVAKTNITDVGDPSFGTANICPDQPVVAKNTSGPDLGYPRWTTWKERYEVFKADGSAPSPWGSPRTTIPSTNPPLTTTLSITSSKSMRILHIVNQANSDLPLWDQNGNMVYYEILLNQDLFNDIVTGTLYNLQGQIALSAKNKNFQGVDFAYGKINQNQLGDIALKLAWKIIDESQGDIPERFYTMGACILDKKENKWVYKKVGLVGMHIVHKTLSSQKWVWSTFEHIDNVQVNEMEALAYANNGILLEPSFNNSYCATCPVNVEPQADSHGVQKTQVMRVTPISKATEELNRQVQELLKTAELLFTTVPESIETLDSGTIPPDLQEAFKKNGFLFSDHPTFFVEEQGSKWRIEDEEQRYTIRLVDSQLKIYKGSVWQYYELIGTQYATDPLAVPTRPDQGLPRNITNKSGGYPAPPYLVNSVIESYDQVGNQEADDLIGAPSPDSREIVFGTQSCMGCHSSATLAVAKVGGQAVRLPEAGDFIFMLEKAQWK